MAHYQRMGSRIGIYIQQFNPSAAMIQSLLSDLLIEDPLLAPLRDVVAREQFQSLKEHIGRGSGVALKDSLIHDLSKTYLPNVVKDIAAVLEGLLSTKATESRATYSSEKSDNQPSIPIDPWNDIKPMNAEEQPPPLSDGGIGVDQAKRLPGSEVCDKNLFNPMRDPEKDKAFLEAWNLRWFNRRYRPRLESDHP